MRMKLEQWCVPRAPQTPISAQEMMSPRWGSLWTLAFARVASTVPLPISPVQFVSHAPWVPPALVIYRVRSARVCITVTLTPMRSTSCAAIVWCGATEISHVLSRLLLLFPSPFFRITDLLYISSVNTFHNRSTTNHRVWGTIVACRGLKECLARGARKVGTDFSASV